MLVYNQFNHNVAVEVNKPYRYIRDGLEMTPQIVIKEKVGNVTFYLTSQFHSPYINFPYEVDIEIEVERKVFWFFKKIERNTLYSDGEIYRQEHETAREFFTRIREEYKPQIEKFSKQFEEPTVNSFGGESKWSLWPFRK